LQGPISFANIFVILDKEGDFEETNLPAQIRRLAP